MFYSCITNCSPGDKITFCFYTSHKWGMLSIVGITIHTQDHTKLKREVKTEVEKESTQVLYVWILCTPGWVVKADINFCHGGLSVSWLRVGNMAKVVLRIGQVWPQLELACFIVFIAQVTADRSGRTHWVYRNIWSAPEDPDVFKLIGPVFMMNFVETVIANGPSEQPRTPSQSPNETN